MDRARAAGYIDNNFVQNQQRLKKRQDHLDRIKKIMTRKPGSSVTLDNTAPVVQQATANDPRKKSKRGIFSVIIERENKVLLQRISAILTEPARDTVKEYDAMKKLVVPKSQGKARLYDQHMEKVRNDKFFNSLKNQKPVYRVKDWEDAYKHQKHNQRFMREVKYVRPAGFVDPFAAPPPETCTSPVSGRRRGHPSDSCSPTKDSAVSSSAHVNRVRNIRASSSSMQSTGSGHHKVRASHEGSSTSAEAHRREDRSPGHPHHHRGSATAEGSDFYGEDDDQYYDEDGYEEEEEGEEFKELLAETRRDIRISEEVAHGRGHHRGHEHQHSHSSQTSVSSAAEVKLNVTVASAEIRCWLVNSEVIVISAIVNEENRQLEAEAEISIEDLAVLRGEDPFLLGSQAGRSTTDDFGSESPHPLDGGGSVDYSLAFDLPTLQQIAAEMASHVELRVDLDSGARLVLNLVSEDEPLGRSLAEGADPAVATGAGSGPSQQQQHGGMGRQSFHSHGGAPISHPLETESLVSEEELGDMLIDDNKMSVLATGLRLPVHFENQVVSSSVANLGSLIDAAKIKSRLDHVYALVKVVSTEDDQLAVTVNVMNNTVTQFKRFARAAVVKGTVLKISTALPSVVHADPELVYTFAQNLVTNIKIVHSNRTGKNTLSIENV